MSRRFGRNQRRRMREEIARLEIEWAKLYAELEIERSVRIQLQEELRDWARRIVALLGPESAFAREIFDIEIDTGLFDLVRNGGAYRVTEPGSVSLEGHPPLPIYSARRIVELFATFAETDRNLLEYRWRFVIRSPEGDAAMLMDERTLQTLRRSDDYPLIDFLVKQLIRPWAKRELPK